MFLSFEQFLMDVRSHELHLVPSTITDIGRVTSSDCINDKIALSTSQHLITVSSSFTFFFSSKPEITLIL